MVLLSEKSEKRVFEMFSDYSRSKKRLKSTDPWSANFWLQTLTDPTIKDPFSRSGKKFRRDFRIPYIIFEEILTMLK